MDREMLLNAIDYRTSRRSYMDKPLSAEHISQIEAEIARINAESGLSFALVTGKGEAFTLTKSYGMFSGVQNYILVAGPARTKEWYESAGYFGEQLVIFMTSLDIATCWVGGTFDRASVEASAQESKVLYLVITVGYATEKMGLKERAIAAVSHRNGKKLGELFRSDGIYPKWFLRAMGAVEKAPSAMNKKPVIFYWKDGRATLSLADAERDGAFVDLGIAKLHFELGACGGTWEGVGTDAVFVRPPEAE